MTYIQPDVLPCERIWQPWQQVVTNVQVVKNPSELHELTPIEVQNNHDFLIEHYQQGHTTKLGFDE